MRMKLNLMGRTLAALTGLAFVVSCASLPTSQKKNEKDPRYQYNMGLVYLNSRGADAITLDRAISFFLKALSLDAKYYLAYNALGLAYSMKGDLGPAAKSFEKCVEINPSFTEARNNLGSIYEALGFIDKAEIEYKKALVDEAYASRQLPLYNLARLAYRQDKWDQALEYVDRALRYDTRMAMAHNFKGLVLEKKEDLEGAITSYEKAGRLVPDDMNFKLNLALALIKTGKSGQAREILEIVLQKTENSELRQKASEALKQLK
ncbi:MAG TPA: tetratricopeptide repeat protein [Acidobacteriota bacterium]